MNLFYSSFIKLVFTTFYQMNQLKNIIVTGSNKGIGYGIVNHLAQSSNWNIIMACRNVELAQKAKS